MPRISLIAAAILLVSASGYKIMAEIPRPELFNSQKKLSKAATQEELEGLNRDLKHKLFALHSYQVLAQRNLTKFDSSLQELEISEIYHSYTYLSLTAARTQIEKIERDLQEIHSSHPELVVQKVKELSDRSPVHYLSLSSLNAKLKLSNKLITAKPEEIEKEYQRLLSTPEFQVFEKNIEHLAHLNKGKSRKSSRMPASIPDNGIDTLDWLAQSSDKITARTNRIHDQLNRRK